MIRLYDILISFLLIVLLSPLLILISIVISLDSRGGIFYRQVRVGRYGRDFLLLKFRTMHKDADRLGGLTIGSRDRRITHAGYWLRRYKLDELPQFLNVIKGDMSLVGPRPEIRKYTDMYEKAQNKVLTVRPGITDYASIEYLDENELLGNSEDPEKTYREVIMPAKISLNMRYIDNQCVSEYFRILVLTIKKVLFQ
jgi:lipopolysaccharide/colanic/teichoic acid biosynthesis glycosyltransferase